MEKEIVIPVKPHVKDYLIEQYGREPIRLQETNINLSILNTDYKYKVRELPPIYSERVRIVTTATIDNVDAVQVSKFNTFIEQQIYLYLMFMCNARPTSRISDILIEAVTVLNLDTAKIETYRWGIAHLKRKIAYRTDEPKKIKTPEMLRKEVFNV